jgi:hypothetical protein
MKRALGEISANVHRITDKIKLHIPFALLAEPFQVPRVVDAFDIAWSGRDGIAAGDMLRQVVDDAKEPVLALDMPLFVMLFEDRAGDSGIFHLVPREQRNSI